MSTEWVVRAAAQQRIGWIGGSVHRVLLDGSATRNRLAVFRSTMRAGAASPVHVHEDDDETVLVLDGTGVFWVGEDQWELGTGDSIFLPRRTPHSYVFTADCEIITVCHPAGMEDFFRAVGRDLTDPAPESWAVDVAELRAAGEATGQHVLGPPLRVGEAMPPRYLHEDASPGGRDGSR